jgi:hypothetical protein
MIAFEPVISGLEEAGEPAIASTPSPGSPPLSIDNPSVSFPEKIPANVKEAVQVA